MSTESAPKETMSPTGSTAAGVADTWNREIHRLVLKVFRARFMLAPLLATIFCVFLVLEPVPWKLVWIGITGILVTVLSVVEYLRIQKASPSQSTIQINLAGAFLAQSSMIYITGGIESPLIIVYVPLGLVTGLSLGSRWRVWTVIVIPVVMSVVFAVGALGHWFARATPEFFGLGQGFFDNPVYVWIKAGLVMVLLVATGALGMELRRAHEKIAFDAAGARREALDSVASRNQEILSVASTVAHELKNPLSSIQGLAQLMARDAPQGSKDAERFDVMRREISRMATVLDEFRNFTRPLSGLRLRSTHLGRLVDDVVQLSEGGAEDKDIRMVVVGGIQGEVVCDPQKVKQALLNLVQNALDATPRGGRVEIELRDVDSRWAQIRITDSGPGMPVEVQQRLFDPGVTTKEHGSGIGLVVARSIAEQHHGELKLSNREAGGCVATLTLSRDRTAAEGVR